MKKPIVKNKIQTLKAGRNQVEVESFPDHYEQVASQGITFPEPHELTWCFDGVVGHGKSSFAASVPYAAHLDFENKAGGLRRHKTNRRFYFGTYQEYKDLLEQLIQDKAGNPFKTIIFDTTKTFVEIVRWALSDEKGVPDVTKTGHKGSGWDAVNIEVTQWFTKLKLAGYGIGHLTHLTQEIITNPEGQQMLTARMDLNAGVRVPIYKQAEFTGVIERAVQKEKDERGRVVGKSTVYLLSFDPGANTPTRQHVPMGDDPIILPDGGGGEAFFQAYRDAVASRKQELENQD